MTSTAQKGCYLILMPARTKKGCTSVASSLKDAFHILGISSLVSAVLMMCWTFYDITTQGYFILGEVHPLIRFLECGLVGFSVIYVLFLLVMFIRKKAFF